MHKLNFNDYERVRPLFRKMDIHLPLQAILAGSVDAPVYVDDSLHPQTALTWAGHRFYLAGAPGNTDLIAQVRKIFLEEFSIRAWKAGIDSYVVYYPTAHDKTTEKWVSFIAAVLEQKYPIKSLRSYYILKSTRHDLKIELPKGFALRPVDSALLTEEWRNLEFLTDEICSERVSVDDFLAKSFGVCLTNGNEIISLCLSEFNNGHQCEVVIATRENYQMHGYATLLFSAFKEMANKRDVARIGWHCGAANKASAATALKVGFEKVVDYPVFLGWFDDVANIARNGYFAHGRGEFKEALSFYEKSFTMGDVSDWVYWGAACDAALIGETEKALKYLTEAIDHGYDDLEHIRNSKYLVNLHGLEGWELILKRLE